MNNIDFDTRSFTRIHFFVVVELDNYSIMRAVG